MIKFRKIAPKNYKPQSITLKTNLHSWRIFNSNWNIGRMEYWGAGIVNAE